MDGTKYASDLTDEQWALIEPLLPAIKSGTRKGGRPPCDRRVIVNGILYLVRSGCQWRMLPQEFGKRPTVHHSYRTWRRDGTLPKIHDTLREKVRVKAGRKPTPTAAILDSQSVKTVEKGGTAGTTRARKSRVESGTSSWMCSV
jgi:transposase